VTGGGRAAGTPLVHHEQCFGCGRTNLFGLLLEVVADRQGAMTGRCFIKQDHQGADRGRAHDGLIGAALAEAMALACGLEARAVSFEISLLEPAAVGVFLEVEARVTERHGLLAYTAASANAEGRMVARARGSFRSLTPDTPEERTTWP
jgi:acyl-coenzyme A thioesterase PaaI-like protein